MEKTYRQIFEMRNRALCYDGGKSTLLCRDPKKNRNIWIKKINGVAAIESVIEDAERYYLACAADDISGYYVAVNRGTGATEWFIPGKAYFQILHGQSLYLIFADEKMIYYLLRVDRASGDKLWHHRVDEDLCEYRFCADRILLNYGSGKNETLSPLSGTAIK